MPAVSLEGLSPEQIADYARAAREIFDDPATRNRALLLRKERSPELHIPEIDLPAQFSTALNEERSKREALEARILEADVRADIERKRAELVKKGIAADKIGDVEKLMTERGIMSHDTAADFYLAQQKLATPTAPDVATRYHSQELPKLGNWIKDHGSVKNGAKIEAMRVMQEIRTGNFAG